jgi:hypothetical protein
MVQEVFCFNLVILLVEFWHIFDSECKNPIVMSHTILHLNGQC